MSKQSEVNGLTDEAAVSACSDPDPSTKVKRRNLKMSGHIGIAVPDVNAAYKRFEELGVKFVKKTDYGKMKGLAFIQDPAGYWIEILNPNDIVTLI